MPSKKFCALVLGGYVNGYNIIRELHEFNVNQIVLFDDHKSMGAYSNKIVSFVKVKNDACEILKQIELLHQTYDFINIFPTQDIHLDILHEIYGNIIKYCFVPFNDTNVIDAQKKHIQYQYCEEGGIPYPKTEIINTIADLKKIPEIGFPLLIKPNKRKHTNIKLFRSIAFQNLKHFVNEKSRLETLINNGVSFIVSEIIPGDASNIYAYTAYRNKNGKILNSWIGKKLSQYPDDFGVFSSASNEAPEIIRTQGEKLINQMNLFGICEPEFKFDSRDGQYKLMEVNLRSMMWHRIGNSSGVNLEYSQWLDFQGKEVPCYKQITDQKYHLVYFTHEILNLIARKKYSKIFKYNLRKGDKRVWAVYDKHDLLPSIINMFYTFIKIIKLCQKGFKTEL